MIDKRAIVHPKVKLADDVEVGPYTVIEENVEIDSGTCVGANAFIGSNTKIGKNNKIFQFATVGSEPQHLAYKGEETFLHIGDNNIIREYCSLHRGTKQGGSYTKIGNNNLLMAYVHIAHDCAIANNIVFANGSSMAGHVQVGSRAVFGGFALVRQFCKIGDYSFITAGSAITKDVLPYTLVSSHIGVNNKKVFGLNTVGLKRNNFDSKLIRNLKRAYHVIFQEGLTVDESILKLEEMLEECPQIQLFIDGLKKSERGIVR